VKCVALSVTIVLKQTACLLALGARPELPIGPMGMPLALLPVMDGDAIRMLQRSGVDYSKLRFRGTTAAEFARQSGNSKLIGVLAANGETTLQVRRLARLVELPRRLRRRSGVLTRVTTGKVRRIRNLRQLGAPGEIRSRGAPTPSMA
jgi:hypothetical protein